MSPTLDPELAYLQHEAYIDYLCSSGSYSEAFDTISKLSRSLKYDNADILQRVSVLLMQADLWRRVGKPEKGFSVALRAASVSFRTRLGPCLWSAVGLLGNILNEMGEWASARRLIESVLPQALEGADNLLTGTLYSHLADSYMGLANPNLSEDAGSPTTPPRANISSSPSSPSRGTAANIAKAELYIDRARECFKRNGYLDGQCDQLMKKAIIAKLRGDEKLAEEWAQNHNRVLEEGRKMMEG